MNNTYLIKLGNVVQCAINSPNSTLALKYFKRFPRYREITISEQDENYGTFNDCFNLK